MQLRKAVRSALQLLLAARLSSSMLSPTPPMGFNDWARFECAINQTVFTDAVDAMVSTGLRDVGFKLVTIDDCWSDHNRTSNGSLTWDTKLFPNGLIWLSDYIHKNKMNFGIYSDAGILTCGGYQGSYNHEEIDAKTFASWGVDYLKLDGCNVDSVPGQSDEETYRQIYERWHPILPPLNITFSESAPAYFVNDKNPVASGKCNATEEQFWNISPQGTISAPFAGNACLSVKGSSVVTENCTSAPGQIWTHGIAGYLVNQATKQCLTEKNSSISVAKCGDELDSQVFEIPL
ncbi:hypothetical protein INT44_006101 [Umbelopsis vinacea]|uniref:Alpha-galactosidase n=1 Tax=Umbelopsis vinacea TaxID=44442 RepID=A0A8H7Q0K7_9FUNG|nr:hypothetical protein INT44_006101 [Umbelopsis vinacea]